MAHHLRLSPLRASTITRLMMHLQSVLEEEITANITRRLPQLPLLSESERHQLLCEWNDTKANYTTNACLHELFEAQVERTPNAIALVFEDQSMTYGELNRRSNQLARHLQESGIGPEVVVGLYMLRSVEIVVGMLGTLKAGGVYLPLDPECPQEP